MSNGILRNRLAGCPAGCLPDVTSTRSFSHQTKIGRSAESPLLRSKAGWSERLPRGQRILDGLAGVRAGGRLRTSFRDSEVVSIEMSVPNVALIPKSIVPPPLAARTRDEQSHHQCFQSQSAATEHPLVRPLRRRISQSVVFNTFTISAFPIVASPASILFPVTFPLSGTRLIRERHAGKFRHRTAALILL